MLGNPNSTNGGVNAKRVLEWLQDSLQTICEPDSIFVQDNAPTHIARVVRDWLEEWAEEHGVEVLAWPAYSPDLNPIETFWKLLKQGL